MKWRVHYISVDLYLEKDFEFGDLKGLKDYLRLQKLSYVPGLFALLGHFEKSKESVSLYLEDNGVSFVVEVVRE